MTFVFWPTQIDILTIFTRILVTASKSVGLLTDRGPISSTNWINDSFSKFLIDCQGKGSILSELVAPSHREVKKSVTNERCAHFWATECTSESELVYYHCCGKGDAAVVTAIARPRVNITAIIWRKFALLTLISVVYIVVQSNRSQLAIIKHKCRLWTHVLKSMRAQPSLPPTPTHLLRAILFAYMIRLEWSLCFRLSTTANR